MNITEGKKSAEVTLSTLRHVCLRAVFLRLPALERTKIRKVCKAWKDAVDDCWSEVDKVSLYRADDYPRSIVRGDARNIIVSARSDMFARKFLEYCAPYLTKFNYMRTGSNRRAVAGQADDVYEPSVFSPLKESRNLEEMYVTIYSNNEDKDLAHILGENRKMREFRVDSASAKHTFWRHVPIDFLRLLSIARNSSDEKSISTEFIEIFRNKMREFQMLEKLALENIINNEMLTIIGEKPDLRTLEIVVDKSRHSAVIDLNKIIMLTNLQRLHIELLRENLIKDEFLKNLAKNCTKLEYLRITPCPEVTDSGLAFVSRLLKLRNFSMSAAPKITDECLRNFTKLEELGLINVNKITDSGVSRLLYYSSSLRIVDISGENVSAARLRAQAMQIARQRDRSAPLLVYINCENIVDI